MENIILIGLCVLQIIVIIILLYFKSYSSKKGENQATKEDIGEITQIVEGIKRDIAENTEKLKSDLALRNEHVISLRVVERDSLINYHKELHSLISFLLRIDTNIYSLENYKEIDKVEIQINTEFYKYDLSEADIELFWDDASFIKRKLDLNILIINLGAKINSIHRILKYQFEIAVIKLANEKNSEIEIHKNLNENISNSVEAYMKEKLEVYRDIRDIDLEIRDMIKQRLVEIIK